MGRKKRPSSKTEALDLTIEGDAIFQEVPQHPKKQEDASSIDNPDVASFHPMFDAFRLETSKLETQASLGIVGTRVNLQMRVSHTAAISEPKTIFGFPAERVHSLIPSSARSSERAPYSGLRDAAVGIAHDHCIILAKYARDNNVVVIWRPVIPQAGEKLIRVESPYRGKGMNVKAKSSIFPPIEGDIPRDPKLSKLVFTEADSEAFLRFKEKTDFLLVSDEADYSKFRKESAAYGPITSETCASFNDRLFVCSIEKKWTEGGQAYPLVYFLDEKGDPVKENDKSIYPLFAIEVGQKPIQYRFYDRTTRNFTLERAPSLIGQARRVEVLAYRQLETKDGALVERKTLITADYDELTSTPAKLFPLDAEGTLHLQSCQFSTAMLRTSSADPAGAQKICAEILFQHELSERSEWKSILDNSPIPYLGNISSLGIDIMTYLKKEKIAIMHGPESHNPWPEKITSGSYCAFLPDGRWLALQNEEEICRFINEARWHGYPLEVNPKWDWEVRTVQRVFRDGMREKVRELFVPERKAIDWDKIQQLLHGLEKDCQEAEDNLTGQLHRLGLKLTDKNLQYLRTLCAGHNTSADDESIEISQTAELGHLPNIGKEVFAVTIGCLRQLLDSSQKVSFKKERIERESDIMETFLKILNYELQADLIYTKSISDEMVHDHKLIEQTQKLDEDHRQKMKETLCHFLVEKLGEFYKKFKIQSFFTDAIRAHFSRSKIHTAIFAPQRENFMTL